MDRVAVRQELDNIRRRMIANGMNPVTAFTTPSGSPGWFDASASRCKLTDEQLRAKRRRRKIAQASRRRNRAVR